MSVAPDLAAFRAVARGLLAREAPPDRVHFDEVRGHPEGLLRAAARWEACGRLAPAVPRDFLGMTRAVLPHRDPGRWALLYRVLWRLTHGEPALLQRHEDTDVRQLRWMEQSVRRDLKAMTDAVRFRRVPRHGREHHVAWYAPEHRILRAVAPFLVRRFASFAWSLFTPDGGAHWDLERLTFAEGTHASGDAAAHAASRARGRSPGPTAGGVPLMLVGMAHEGGDSPSFTGPAGQLLALVLGRAGLLGPTAPVTHGVVPCGAGCGTWPLPEGARTSCRHGLDAAVARARPRMVIALGAQAAQAFLGVGFRIHISRGQVLSSRWAEGWMATLETEAIVRLTGARERAEARIHLEADFRSAAAWLRQRSPGDGVRPRVG